jgi:hypothetical protein
MTKRPLNQCLNPRCGYTWQPHGHDLAKQCPQCRGTAVTYARTGPQVVGEPSPSRQARSTPLSPIQLVLGCVMLLGGGLFVAIFLFGLIRQPGQAPSDPPVAKDDPAEKEIRDKRPKPDRQQETKTEAAPLPRAVPLNRPPEGFITQWQRRGGVQTRVIGATIAFPILTDDAHREFPSKTEVLLVWVETQSLTTNGISLRRWLNPLNEYAKLTNTDGVRFKPTAFPNGARVGGEIEGGHSLPPGGPSIVDVLAFEVPSAATRTVYLILNATHVVETGEFVHAIPHDVWSKK